MKNLMLIFMMAVGLVLTGQAAGATYYVDANGSADFNSIQAAIDASSNDDEIEVAPGTYNEYINFNNKAVRLYSSGGQDVTTIDANGAYHAVKCVNSEDANTILEGFTITGGNANGSSFPDYYGGGMLNENSSPTVTYCIFSGNSATYGGGGMYNRNSGPTVINCTFSGNSATYASGHGGGGMNNQSGSSPTVTNCTFSLNTVTSGGGGMSNSSSSSPTVTDCIFSQNTADTGGGMNNAGNSNPIVANCIFIENSARQRAGMSNGYDGNPTVINCTFRANVASSSAGAIGNNNNNPIITGCTFIANEAYDGGAISNGYDGNPTVTNCSFSGNLGFWGGAIKNYDSNPTVTNCIMWGDTATYGPEIYNSSSSPTVTYSDVQGGYTGTGNINADPCFVDADANDFRLLYDSPCIDAGNNSSVPVDTADLDNDGNTVELIPYDLDGHPRILDGDCNDTPIVDMGAFEFNYAYEGDFDYDCNVNFKDFTVFAMAWLTKPPEPMWNRFCDIGITTDDYINLFDLDVLAQNWLEGW